MSQKNFLMLRLFIRAFIILVLSFPLLFFASFGIGVFLNLGGFSNIIVLVVSLSLYNLGLDVADALKETEKDV